ncbi:hypothetical protein A1A1_17590 [Planococcus antarcticus DSM 14505]|uniref:Uncharacterized protein n=1 Tax=Planococcus antarcticus DSM 14505 TaxID=1185653 RepID=A0A1C7DI12_9BACL|nr:hypothetical protein [Planococcus antarcticus]ANU10911.1 hypothetical protein BBH88_11615 [Planococcus antarcticus DSM 14505]EIM05169.1 hypothetical protein A1A1_17590 [Planococcus antarcticus DSM 14505]
MEQMEQLPRKSVDYFFLRSKDVHIENGSAFITFFARLTREVSFRKDGEKQTRVQTVWVDVDEVKLEHASKKARGLPNCMQRYELSQNVFYNLYQLAKKSPKDLFHITPYCQKSTREKFIV